MFWEGHNLEQGSSVPLRQTLKELRAGGLLLATLPAASLPLKGVLGGASLWWPQGSMFQSPRRYLAWQHALIGCLSSLVSLSHSPIDTSFTSPINYILAPKSLSRGLLLGEWNQDISNSPLEECSWGRSDGFRLYKFTFLSYIYLRWLKFWFSQHNFCSSVALMLHFIDALFLLKASGFGWCIWWPSYHCLKWVILNEIHGRGK